MQRLAFGTVAYCDRVLNKALFSTNISLMSIPGIPSRGRAVISRIFHFPSVDALTWKKYYLETTVVFLFPSILTVTTVL